MTEFPPAWAWNLIPVVLFVLAAYCVLRILWLLYGDRVAATWRKLWPGWPDDSWWLVVLVALLLPGCAASKTYVDQRVEDVDAKVRAIWDATEHAVLTAQASGKEAGEAVVAGVMAGAAKSRDDLPVRTDTSDVFIDMILAVLTALGYGGVGVGLTRVLRGAPLKSGGGKKSTTRVRK